MENNFKMKFIVEEEINIDFEDILEIHYENIEENPNAPIEQAIADYFALMEDRYYNIFCADREKNTDKIIYNLCNYLITKNY